MLLRLRLQDFVVVEGAEIAFCEGLTVITGETGAGKSIILNALGLLTGARADVDVIRTGCTEAAIEGVFEIRAALRERLEVAGLPCDGEEVVVRRTVERNGRGRVHVNGSMTTVGVLSRLFQGSIDVGGQHDHSILFEVGEHLAIVDRFGGIRGSAGAYQGYAAAFGELKALQRRLAELGGDAAEVRTQSESLAFQISELERFDPKPGELAVLDAERRKLQSVEKLRGMLGSIEAHLESKDGSAVDLLGKAIAQLVEGERIDPSLASVRAHLSAAQHEASEASLSLSRYAEALDSDPARLEVVEDRLSAMHRLARRHGVAEDELCSVLDARRSELEELLHRDERRSETEALLVNLRVDLGEKAKLLTQARGKACTTLAKEVGKHLEYLALAGASFDIVLEPTEAHEHGADQVQFMMSANAGTPLRPLVKVASGGEASRIMLALKSAIGTSDMASCSAFDEPDAGLGGAAADAVGRLLRALGEKRQVLCVTHLPQVAAYASGHLTIDKRIGRRSTTSTVRILESEEERADELARMLSGSAVTAEALAAAHSLLLHATQRVPGSLALVRGNRGRRPASANLAALPLHA